MKVGLAFGRGLQHLDSLAQLRDLGPLLLDQPPQVGVAALLLLVD